MRTTSPEMTAALAREAATIAICWRIQRADGVTIGLTTHDRDLWIGGCHYLASPGLSPSAVLGATASDPITSEASGVLSSEAISEADLEAGRYDGAALECLMVDWTAPDAGTLLLSSGLLGAISTDGQRFVAELVSRLRLFQESGLEGYSPECRASLGDARCSIDPARHMIEVIVVAVDPAGLLTADRDLSAEDAFRYGRARVLTGAASGLDRSITWSAGRQFEVDEQLTGLAVGDLIELRAGCDRQLSTCRDRFANVANFRGEPHVPGTDAMAFYPGLS